MPCLPCKSPLAPPLSRRDRGEIMANKVCWFCTRALSAHLCKGLPYKRDTISSYLALEMRGGRARPACPIFVVGRLHWT
jgi:hypothetical protein